jgi:uncharacterized protein (TIGR00297 family)
MPDPFWLSLLTASLMSAGSLLTRKISLGGALTGGLITFLLLLAFGIPGLTMIFVFFTLGTAASVWRKRDKRALGLEEKNEGKRNHVNVVSNAGVALVCTSAALLLSDFKQVPEVMMAASFSSALSDTFSSELGNVYGSRFVNIRTFSAGKRGDDGVISLEGSLFGLGGSLLAALAYSLSVDDFGVFWLVSFTGMAGNLSDSWLGAVFQQRGLLNNHSVNFFSTLIAALLAGAYLLMS